MILFEDTEKTYTLEEVSVEYDLLEYEDLPAQRPEVVLYFNKERKLDSIDDIIIPIKCVLPGIEEKKYVTITFTCVNFDDTFDISALSDDVYEVEELPDGYMVTIDNIDSIYKILNAEFTESVVYPFDNSSKNDIVNKYLAKDNINLSIKIAKYLNDLVYKTDEYKSIHSSWSNQKTRATKKAVAANTIRAGRTDLEILLDTLKTIKGVQNIQTGTIADPTGKFKNRWRIRAIANKLVRGKPTIENKMFEVITDAKGKQFVCRILGDTFNGYKCYSAQSVISWVRRHLYLKNIETPAEINTPDEDSEWGDIVDTADEFTKED